MIAVCLFLVVPWVCLQFVNVVFPDHTHLLFLRKLRTLFYVTFHFISDLYNIEYRLLAVLINPEFGNSLIPIMNYL